MKSVLKKILLPLALAITGIAIFFTTLRNKEMNTFWARAVVNEEIEKAKKNYDKKKVEELREHYNEEVEKHQTVLENADKEYIKKRFLKEFS